MPASVSLDSPEWHKLLDKLRARSDLQDIFTCSHEDYLTKKQWDATELALRELDVALEPYERMKIHAALLEAFFPAGVPWPGSSGKEEGSK